MKTALSLRCYHLPVCPVVKLLKTCWCWCLIKERGQHYESYVNKQFTLWLLGNIAVTSYGLFPLVCDQLRSGPRLSNSTHPGWSCISFATGRTTSCRQSPAVFCSLLQSWVILKGQWSRRIFWTCPKISPRLKSFKMVVCRRLQPPRPSPMPSGWSAMIPCDFAQSCMVP